MTRSHRHWYAFVHTYGHHCQRDGDPIGRLWRFHTKEARDQFVTDADEPYITAPGYTEAIDPREACYRRIIDRSKRPWGEPIPHGDANRDATITQEGRRTMSEHYNLERFVAAPGDHHEAWCKIDDVWDGEYLTGTIESVPDDQTFIVRAVPSGRLWECRHLGDGRVLEAEVIG